MNRIEAPSEAERFESLTNGAQNLTQGTLLFDESVDPSAEIELLCEHRFVFVADSCEGVLQPTLFAEGRSFPGLVAIRGYLQQK